MQFGIGQDTKGSNPVPFNPGINGAILVKVAYEVTEKKDKSEKYDTLVFYFKGRGDAVGRDYKHVEWAVAETDEKAEGKINASNVRIKHIYEAFRPCPTTGIGTGANNWAEYFTMIAKQFNEDNNGSQIFVIVHPPAKEGEAPRKEPIPLNILVHYGYKDAIQFPYSPNFVEKDSGVKGKTSLVIDKRYHKMKQTDAPEGNGNPLGAMMPPGGTDLNDFIPNDGNPTPF